MASIHDRGKGRPNRWQVKYRIFDPELDRWVQRSESFAVKADAKAFAGTVEVETRAGTLIDPQRAEVTFGVFAADVISSLERDLRATSRARTRSALDGQVLPTFRRIPLGAIDHRMIQRWLDGLTDSGLAPGTVHKAWQTFRKVIGAAVDARLLRVEPWGKIRLPRIERHEARFLEPAEVDRLADAIGDQWRAFVYLGALCGLRAGELFGLRWSDVDLEADYVEVRENAVEADGKLVVNAPKTAASRRRVPLPAVVVDELELHRLTAADPARGLVFPNESGSYWRASNFRHDVWKPATRAAGLSGLVIHELRHSAVAGWIAAGADPVECAARAGHRSVVTILDRYGHRYPTQAARVNDALDAMYREARTGR